MAYKSADIDEIESLINLPGGPSSPTAFQAGGGRSNALSFMINGMLDFGDEEGVELRTLVRIGRHAADGVIEAVGEEYWPAYFASIDRLLAPGGVAAVQAILMAHDRFLTTRNSYGWIQKHIFPGGLIPSERAIEETTREHTSLRITDTRRFGRDYAETLRRWRRTFLQEWPTIAAGGFGTLGAWSFPRSTRSPRSAPWSPPHATSCAAAR